MIAHAATCLTMAAVAMGCGGRAWQTDETERISATMRSELDDPVEEARARAIAVSAPPLAPYSPPEYVIPSWGAHHRTRGRGRRSPVTAEARPEKPKAPPRARTPDGRFRAAAAE